MESEEQTIKTTESTPQENDSQIKTTPEWDSHVQKQGEIVELYPGRLWEVFEKSDLILIFF